MPRVPEEIRRLTDREASCIACHVRGEAPPIAPGETRTPAAHPSFDPAAIRRSLDGGRE